MHRTFGKFLNIIDTIKMASFKEGDRVEVLMEAVAQDCREEAIKPEERNLNNKGKKNQVRPPPLLLDLNRETLVGCLTNTYPVLNSGSTLLTSRSLMRSPDLLPRIKCIA